ncbi:MAG: D-alanyl-D-alanine carboxypeptidase [Alphaproteobacteria bacterium]|nr:D-alanyl-D-alanine carboxypeptidase [Alphaproteobacteria bacterium]
MLFFPARIARSIGRFAFVLILSLLFMGASPAAARYAAIVIEADTGRVVYEKNPDKRNFPASLTKMMTLYMLFDRLAAGKLTLGQQLPVSTHASSMSPSKLGLKPGETISVEDVVLALCTRSANDAAVVAAEAIGGSESKFAAMMTDKARQLGMMRTTFRNASGLPNNGQLSTARDMATLGRALIRTHGRYYHYFSTRQFVYKGDVIGTHNRLMLRYAGADGIKTGYINASGFNLVASAKREGQRLIGVVFGGNTAAARDNHMADLLDRGFAALSGGEKKPEPLIAAAPEPRQPPAPTRAAMKALPRDEDKAERMTGSGDAEPGWGIQVGAFGKSDPAEAAAMKVSRQYGHLIGEGEIRIEPVRSAKGTIYRARILGLSETKARNTCKRMERAKQTCQVVTPRGQSLAMAR